MTTKLAARFAMGMLAFTLIFGAVMPAAAESSSTSTVQVYLVAIDANAPQDQLIGCGDQLIAVQQNVQPANTTEQKITEALQALFNIKDRFYGQSGLYNCPVSGESEHRCGPRLARWGGNGRALG